MTTANEGRNEIRFNNSNAKCLLENWVEERAVSDIDRNNYQTDGTSSSELLRVGHQGLLTTDFTAPHEKLTTFGDSYRPPTGPGVRGKGSKQEMLERMLYEQVSQEVDQEVNAPPEAPDYKSVTNLDYTIEDFVPTKTVPTAEHDYRTDQPVTFWTEHKDVIHGVSQCKQTFNSAFRKNTAFSKPIEESWEQPKPYEQEKFPNM